MIKTFIHKCPLCQRRRKKAMSQQMAPLPEERVRLTKPFEITGVDVMGPWLCRHKGSKALHKCWVMIFSDFSSRAVHAECMPSMDASTAINAIVRFAARRPGVKKFWSDNGGNFVKANKILIEEVDGFKERIGSELEMRSLEWEFIPPYAPHRGGIWERVVGLFKKHLSIVLSGEVQRYDNFTTVVTEVESILNKCPLCANPDDSRDFEALTPNHLICPGAYISPMEPERDAPIVNTNIEEKDAVRHSWVQAQGKINSFWKRFKHDYVSLLHQRSKWRKNFENIKVNDLVVLIDETVCRSKWEMGIVQKIHQTGPHVRKAEIRRSNGKIELRDRRHVVKLEIEGIEK